MKILNTVTYTARYPGFDTRIEERERITRPYALTIEGAQRIMRKKYPAASLVVTNVEGMVDLRH